MYKNLEEEIRRNNITKKHLANKLKISERILDNKIKGKVSFYWKEAQEIRDIIAPQVSLDYLFECDSHNKVQL